MAAMSQSSIVPGTSGINETMSPTTIRINDRLSKLVSAASMQFLRRYYAGKHAGCQYDALQIVMTLCSISQFTDSRTL
jgi:hypothetical protein